MAKNYGKVPVKVQKKSGFDKSFQNLFTSKVGTITPILCDELIPNSTVHLRAAINASLPPLASDTFMRCKLKYAAFFVPTRLLVQGYERWLTGSDYTAAEDKKVKIPLVSVSSNILNKQSSLNSKAEYFGPGSLADYLGMKWTESQAIEIIQEGEVGYVTDLEFNALPFLAYHRIYNDWFRNSRLQKDIYAEEGSAGYSVASSNSVAPCVANGYKILINDAGTGKNSVYNDSKNILQLRQANFGYDIFTTATPSAQNGEAQAVTMTKIGDEQAFTISALRAANSIQQFLERNNLAGNRLVDYVHAQYGANLSDSIAQRPILLGKGNFDIYSKGIYQTSSVSDDGYTVTTQGQNPFVSVGARFGSPFADGTDTLVDSFTAMEPGYLMVMCWLSPKVTYGTGTDPILSRYLTNSVSDLANPLLQNVGNEPIYSSQLTNSPLYKGRIGSDKDTIFGYVERYANWKDKQDEVHGLMRDTSSLQSFALQRCFDHVETLTPTINSLFIQIPTDYLDQVSAVKGQVSEYGYWADTFFDYKVSMPLATYSVPSLQDPAYEHGVDVMVDKNGKQLN